MGLRVAVLAALDLAKSLFVSLESGLPGPVPVLNIVELQTQAHLVKVSELELGFGVAVFCGFPVPAGRLHKAEWHALTKVVEGG